MEKILLYYILISYILHLFLLIYLMFLDLKNGFITSISFRDIFNAVFYTLFSPITFWVTSIFIFLEWLPEDFWTKNRINFNKNK